jgi:uncharacterized membrane protein
MIPELFLLKSKLFFTGVSLLSPEIRKLSSILLLFFITVLPANLNAALQHIVCLHATAKAPGSNYL